MERMIENILEYPFDSKLILRRKTSIKRKLLESGDTFIQKKIAVLGGSTTSEIVDILELFLLNAGIKPEFYESDYGQFWFDAVYRNGALIQFHPDVVYIHTSNRNIRKYPSITDSKEDINQTIEDEYLFYKNIWDTLSSKIGCIIIQNNFEMPYYRLLGNNEACDIHGKMYFLNKINERFYQYYQENTYFYINDINYLSAVYGLEKWSKPLDWYLYKYSLDASAIPTLTNNIANIIKSIYGKNKKALIVDLDNTLWGGEIGDDGINQIQIGQETPIAQAYYEFQSYLKELKNLGVILNINSKNDFKIASSGLNDSDSVLKMSDFASIQINWENKAQNTRKIINDLNISEDSFVFIDDNPAERDIVKMSFPKISVPTIDSVETYIHTIDKSGYFEFRNIDRDDVKRTEMYQSNLKRSGALKKYLNYDEYLEALDMEAEIGRFNDRYLSRITQLINKTNQFNLTTKRLSESEVKKVSCSESNICLYGKLKDKYGDNGLISAIVGEIDGDILDITLWVMSCRVFSRNMEYLMMDSIVYIAKKRHLSYLIGRYIKTERNSIVKEFYSNCGFQKLSEEDNGNTVWRLSLERYERQNKYIRMVNADE